MTLFTCLFMVFFVIVMLRFQSEVSSLSATSVKIIKSNQSDEVDSDYKVIDYNYYYDYEAIDKIPKYQNETPRYEDFSPAEPGKTKKPKKTTTTRATTTTSTQSTSTILSYTPSNNNNEYPSTQSTTTLGGNDEEPTTTEEITTTTTNEASTASTPEATTTTNPTTQSSSTTQSTSTSTDKVTINCREKVEELLAASQNAKKLSGNVCEVVKPYIGFNLTLGDIRTEVKVNIESLDRNMLLIYFPSHYKPFEGSSDELLSCIEIESESLTITDLSPSIAYLFCILYSGDKMVSPYQCQSFMVQKGTPWIFENQKEKLIVACIVGIVVMFTVGVAIAYATIFAFPMLLKGSDRVIIVKKELRSISNKLEVPDVPETPIYLTPLPRPPREYQTMVRSASDSTWQNYAAINPMLPNRLSFHLDYTQGYANKPHEYLATENSIKSSERNSVVRSLSADGGRASGRDEYPYARVNKKAKAENNYDYLL